MHKYTLYLLFIGLVLSLPVLGQSAADALRFSQMERHGGARNIGVNGTLGALGADFGVLSTNPAGLAAFRKSELMFTTALQTTRFEARLSGNPSNEFQTERINRIHIPNFGLVIAHRPTSSRWKTFNVGLGLNQIVNYRQQMFYEGRSAGTITQRFLEQANGLALNELEDFEGGLAYDASAIYNPDANNIYTSDFEIVPGREGAVMKNEAINRKGYLNELQLAFASNYDDKLYTGITIGIPILNYEEQRSYSEIDNLDTIPFFDKLNFNQNLSTSGTGINVKLGFIYRASQAFRVGGAVHTPTLYSLTDNYQNTLDYNYTVNDTPALGSAESPEGVFDYRLSTPWRMLGNMGFIMGKSGFISAEVEWVDYSTAAFNFTHEATNAQFREAQRAVNSDIENQFRDALNVRVGGEYVYNIFRFRAGYGLSGTEYAEDNLLSRSWSAGLGIRENSFYLDLGFRRFIREETYIPYTTSAAPELEVRTKRVQDLFALTLGLKI
jgi:hypothetical protein